jgi:putative N6-adenine-specific DNA methylase
VPVQVDERGHGGEAGKRGDTATAATTLVETGDPVGRLTCFAITAPGLEALLAAELTALGLPPHDSETGGVEFETDRAGLYRANLHLRVASRVVVRMAAFKAAHFSDLERHAAAIDWKAWIPPGAAVHFRITSRKSRLYHQKAIADRLEAAVLRAMPGSTVVRGATEAEALEDAQTILVRFAYDQCQLSADSSGALLHLRGYRQAVARAPLRETLAAAMLLGAGWDPATALVDPMCGAGTIPIEAALLARRIPPGWQRRFAFERWPGFDPAGWQSVRARAQAAILPAGAAPILASDRDPGAIQATTANAERAGVLGDLTIRQCALSAIEPPALPGLVLTNPPYGLRIGEAGRLRDLFAQVGHLMRHRLPGWRLGLLSANPMLERQLDLPLATSWTSINGGIPVRLVVTEGD